MNIFDLEFGSILRFMHRLLILVAGVMALQVNGQVPGAGGQDFSLYNYTVDQWTTNSGLTSNNLTSVFQASDGYLWVTSFNGILRFDGNRFETYDRSDLPKLRTDAVYQMAESDQNRLWFATQGSGIYTYFQSKFAPFEQEGTQMPMATRTIYHASDSTIYVGTFSSGLYKIKDNKLIKTGSELLNSATILAITEDENSSIWIATEQDGLFKLSGDSVVQYGTNEGLLQNSILSLAPLKNGLLAIGYSDGLQVWSTRSNKVFTELKGNQVNGLYVDKYNFLWIALENGLGRWNSTTGKLEFIKAIDGIDFVRMSSITEDREGNIWLTSGRSGLIRLKQTNITNILLNQNLSSNRVNIVSESWDKQIYAGSDANGIIQLNGSEASLIPLNTPLNGNGVRDIYKDRDGSFWLATYSGIIHKQGNKEVVYNKSTAGFPVSDFRLVFRDSRNRFWFGSRSGGAILFDKNKVVRVYNEQSGLSSNYILAIREDRYGNVFVGTHSGGLTKIKPDGSVESFHFEDGDAGILIFNIDFDKHGNLWITANVGMFYFNGSRFKPVNMIPASHGRTYFDGVFDNNGNYWLTTNDGLLRFREADLGLIATDKITAIPYFNFDESDGMNNRECTGATRSTLLTNGKIYVPTIGGICVIDPNRERKNKVHAPVIITGFKVDSEDFMKPESVVPPGHFRFNFQFTAINFTAPNKSRLQYRLQNVDANWIEANQREVEYTNLKPGEYVFEVRGSNNDGLWNPTTASFKFQVKPYFYETYWFYIILIVSIGSILYAIYKWRLNFVERQNATLKKLNGELDRFVYSASHDLRAPLASILGLINITRLDTGENQKEYLSMMEKSVRRLDSFIQDIIDYSRNARTEVANESVNLERMIQESLQDLQYLDNFESIKKEIQVDKSETLYSDEKRLKVVLNNLLSNAIRHHDPENPAPWIRVEVTFLATMCRIKVADNGSGIPPEHHEHIYKMFYRATQATPGSGLGLYIVKETLDRLKGTITLESSKEIGTTFTIMIPNGKPSNSGKS